MTSVAENRTHHPIDISADEFWRLTPDAREQTFARLRAEAPVSWQRPIYSPIMGGDDGSPGYWAVVRAADITTVSRRADVFSSASGGVTFEEMPEEILEMASSILTMDDPRHHQIRKLISSTFTPKRVKLIEEQIANQARLIVESIKDKGEAEFVHAVSARLPLWTISEMIGIPEDRRQEVVAAANAMIGWGDDETIADSDSATVMLNGIVALHGACQDVIDERRETPQNDLISALIAAEVDGQHLTDDEIRAFFVLLCVAGNDTTKQTTTHTLRALTEHPDQRDWLFEDYDTRIGGAIEEFVRWATPVMTFRRTALERFELGGSVIEPGDKVALFYSSGNRDEATIDRPREFDITRKPGPHVAFGGGGPHYCLGSHLAKAQLRSIFREIYTQLPDIRAVGEPKYLVSTFINGIQEQRCEFTPR
ncbi:cytochrome P450 [Pseudonocardia xishanensis]|uniref:Cytochrome P450 n=1 Tax=Pseudonocardia xishanensis TaxID=630995 RepID=A0ABP8RT30_9PSEU